MEYLVILYRFRGLPFIVEDENGEFYQLPHVRKTYKLSFRKLNVMLNNGITEGYRINRKFVLLSQLRKLAYKHREVIEMSVLESSETSF